MGNRMEDETRGMKERTEGNGRSGETGTGHRVPETLPGGLTEEEIERGRQRALKVFRYGGMGYFLLLGLVALLLHLQGVLGAALEVLAAGVLLLLFLALPFVLLGGLMRLLLRPGRRDGDAGDDRNPGGSAGGGGTG